MNGGTPVSADPCNGPNHGNSNVLPAGQRIWTKGYALSVTQTVEGEPDAHLVFCSADCMCDWHGAHAAYAEDKAGVPEFEIVGRFSLVWVTPSSTLVRVYPDWDGLTAQVGEYQRRILKLQEAAEGGWVRPFEA